MLKREEQKTESHHLLPLVHQSHIVILAVDISQIEYHSHNTTPHAHHQPHARYPLQVAHPHPQATNKKSTLNHFVGVRHTTELQDGSHTDTLANAL